MSVSLCFLFWGIFVKINCNDLCKTLVYCLVCIRYLLLVSHFPLHSPSFLPKLLSPIAKFCGQFQGLLYNPCQHWTLLTVRPFLLLSPVVFHNAAVSCFLPAFTILPFMGSALPTSPLNTGVLLLPSSSSSYSILSFSAN